MDRQMAHKISRREALQLPISVGVSSLLLQSAQVLGDEVGSGSVVPLLPSVDGEGLTSYLQGGHVAIRWNNFVIATYRASPIQKYPYFSHLAGPLTGLPLTTESSLPFPHHRGLWLGCDPLNGGDYWTDTELDKGQIRSIDLHLGETTATSVEIRNRCQWLRRGAGSPLIDQRSITFYVPNKQIRLIDFDVKITALEKISVKKAKHSFFALRVAPDLAPLGGGRLENSAGDVGEAGTYGKPAHWCSFFGKRAGHNAVEGIAVMDHPANPWIPCPWFTRDYGHLSPSPFNFLEEPWQLAEGASIRLRYRVVLHVGDPKEAGLNELYNEWKST
jgi:hypothetical protein